MRLASLELWADVLHLGKRHMWLEFAGELKAMDNFALGLFHDDGHLEQIAEAVRVAAAARTAFGRASCSVYFQIRPISRSWEETVRAPRRPLTSPR